MNKILIILSLVLLASCGPSAEEKRQVEMEQQRIEQEASEKLAQEKANRISAVTCSIMSETRNMDAAIRVREMNDARVKIGGEPFLRGDDAIKESLEWGLCQKLVLNESYDETLQPLKDAKRETERIAAEKRAEEKRIAAEKQRIADSKPTVKEKFYLFEPDKLESRINYQPKSDGGLKHGLSETFHEDGKLMTKANYVNGKIDGTYVSYDWKGRISHREFHNIDEQLKTIEYYSHRGHILSQIVRYKNKKAHGLQENYYDNGQLEFKGNYKDGEEDGLFEQYYKNGQLEYKKNYKDGKEIPLN